MPRAKVATTYANSILANTEALQDGYDEALLLDTDGFVAEGSAKTCSWSGRGALRAGNRLGPDRHHPLHHPCAGRRPGPARRDQAADPGRCLSPTRPSSPAPPPKSPRSARSTTARSAQAAGARHRSPAEGLLRRGAWPQPEVPSLAEQNLIRAALLISRQAASLPPTQPSHGSFISGIPMTAASPAAVSSAQHEVIEVGAEDLPSSVPAPRLRCGACTPRLPRRGPHRFGPLRLLWRRIPSEAGTVLHGHH